MTSSINAIVEGESDVPFVQRIIAAAGHDVGRVVVKGGSARLDAAIPRYATAARYGVYLVLRDSDGQCPVELRARLLADARDIPDSFILRIAHSMIESWALADPAAVASYFRIRRSSIPADPEQVADPKRLLLQLCMQSRSTAIRSAMVRSEGRIGTGYVQHMQDFALNAWDPLRAAERSDSLRRALERLSAVT